jgi:tetraacyldisaccharide 4'-kinase
LKRPWLAPLVPLYLAGAALRAAGLRHGLEPVRKLRWPVVSVGNLSVGGTGKTPFLIALAGLLVREGIHVDVLSRGYGREDTAVSRVDPAGSAERFGDEPLLIANVAGVPVYVGAERWKAGHMAEEEWQAKGQSQGATQGVHLLDDGFQHRQLARQVDIVLVNSEDLGDSMLPAGNLREGLGTLERAHVLAVPEGDDAAVERLQKLGLGPQREQPVWRFRREMVVPEIPESLAVRPVVAFCGIARPEQFFSGLERKGIKMAVSRAFPDHHHYTAKDVAMLQGLAQRSGSGALVTTAKDLYRLGGLGVSLDWSFDGTGPIFAVDLRVELEDEPGIAAWLRHALETAAN